MKLAAISHHASRSAPTGAERSLAALAAALRKRGHEVGVVAPGPWCLASELAAAGVEMATIPSRPAWLVQWGEQPLSKQVVRYLRFRAPDPGVRRMTVWLDRFWPEVVHVNCLPQLKGAAAARSLGLPVVWHIREILPPGRRRRWFARRLGRDATRIVAVSHAVAGWIADEGLGERIEVVHNGCDPARPSRDRSALRADIGLPEAGVAVGFFAQLVEHKGSLDLVAAALRAMATVDDLWVVMAGDGPKTARRELAEAVGRCSDPERFRLLPPRADVADLLAAIDVAVIPSRWPDPLPRSVMEAMAAGRPVVATRVGGVPEMVVEGETGFMVEAGDVEALAERMVRLAGDGKLRRRMGEAAAERARAEFSIGRHVDRMEAILSEVAARGRR